MKRCKNCIESNIACVETRDGRLVINAKTGESEEKFVTIEECEMREKVKEIIK